MRKSFVLELHDESSEFADECIALLAPVTIAGLQQPAPVDRLPPKARFMNL